MAITFDQVTFDYGDRRREPALKDVSLEIAEGSFTCIVGCTGSGKSTLVDQIGATVYPTNGRVLVDGMDTNNAPDRPAIRRLVGHVVQYPEYQLFAETVKEDLAFGPTNLGFSAEKIEASVTQSATMLGINLDRIGERSPFDLSGGQRRRVAIAGIVAMNPKYLILDEPMVGLDPEGRAGIRSWLRHLTEQGHTVIMVTHSMEDAAELSDRIVVLSQGRVLFTGTPREVFSNTEVLDTARLLQPEAMRFAQELLDHSQPPLSAFDASASPRAHAALARELDPLPLTLTDLAAGIARARDFMTSQEVDAWPSK